MPPKKPQFDDPRSDAQLVDAADTGDLQAFAALYNRHRRWVVDLAFRFTNDPEQSLDVLQQTFEYFLRKFPGFQLQSNMRTFLYPVVRHIAISMQRQARRMTYLRDLPPTAAASTNPDAAEVREQLAAIVNNLPPGQREVVFLRYVDCLSLQGIATVMNIPLGTVKSRLHHALTALRADEITKKYFEEFRQ